MTQQMQAIRIHQYGGPDELKLETVPQPEPQADEVLVRIHATGVLPIEWKIRQGFMQGYMPVTFPYSPGSAFAGVIEAVGAGVTTFQPGQAVFGRSNKGAYAEYTTPSIETIALKPDALSFAEAATISGGATTAWSALFGDGGLEAGHRVLIHAGAGGVGLFAVQFARWKGAQVISTASTANVDFVRSLGATTVIDYTTTPFETAVQDVDLVLDTMGGAILERSFDVVKRGGTLVSLLGVPPQEKALARGIRAINNTAPSPYPSTALLQRIAQLMVEGQVKTVVAQTFPLAAASQAHALSQTGHGRGRLVLQLVDE